MEGAFGTDFSSVRVHTDSSAVQMNKELGAQAFTNGSDIYFNEGKFDTGSSGGQHLLAHELTHTVQQGDNGIIQKYDWAGPDLDYGDSYDSVEVSCTNDDPSFNPCIVPEFLLSNRELIQMSVRVKNYIDSTARGECQYYDYANLGKRLFEERDRRIRSGYGWLSEHVFTEPYHLFQVEVNMVSGNVLNITQAEVATQMEYPRDMGGRYILTSTQLDSFLLKAGVHVRNPENWFTEQYSNTPIPLTVRLPSPGDFMPSDFGLRANSGMNFFSSPFDRNPFDLKSFFTGQAVSSSMSGLNMYRGLFDVSARGAFSQPVYSDSVRMSNARSMSGARTNWRGDFPEMAFGQSTLADILAYTDLNRLQADFPSFDFRQRGSGRLIQVTHTMPDVSGQVRWSHYENKLDLLTGQTRPIRIANAIDLVNQNFGDSLTLQTAIQQSFLAVNNDHVEPMRQRIIQNPERFPNLMDSVLGPHPITQGNLIIRNWNSLQDARTSNRISAAEYRVILESLGPIASRTIIANGMTTAMLSNLQELRIAHQNVPQADFHRLVPPELMESIRLGRDSVGTFSPQDFVHGRHQMAQSSAMRGAGRGMAISGAINLGDILINPQNHPYALRELAINLLSTGLGEGSAAYMESYLNATISRALLTRATSEVAAEGSATALSRLAAGSRGFTAVGTGTFAAPAVTLASMGIEDIFFDADYSAIDYVAKGGRAAVSGGIAAGSGWLASAGTGALLGSEVPIVGTAVGFLVGLGVYYIADSAIGEEVEEGIRYKMGEQGCIGQPPMQRPDGNSQPSPPGDYPVERNPSSMHA